MSDSKTILALIIRAIVNNREDELVKYLNHLPIAKLSLEKSNNLLITFLKSAQEVNNGKMARTLIGYWENNNPGETKDPILIGLLLLCDLIPQLLFFVLKEYGKDMTYFFYLQALNEKDASAQVLQACNFLDKYYGLREKEFYLNTLNTIRKEQRELGRRNKVLETFLIRKIRAVTEYAEIPKWVGNNLSLLPLESELRLPKQKPLKELPPLEEAVKLMTDGLRLLGINRNDILASEKYVTSVYNASTTEEKLVLISPFYQAKNNIDTGADQEIFRILGPANPMITYYHHDDDSICLNYGGCRMFTCKEFENYNNEYGISINEDDYEDVEWFKGYCQNEDCNKRIRSYHHAVRMPMEHGGWYGCYCSWSCVKSNMATRNKIINLLIIKFETDIEKFGIQDRIIEDN